MSTDGEIRDERVNVRMTKGDRSLLKAYVAKDAATLAPHGVKVSESSVLIACLRARQIRESGLDSPEKIAAFNSVSPQKTVGFKDGPRVLPPGFKCAVCEQAFAAGEGSLERADGALVHIRACDAPKVKRSGKGAA